MNTIKIISLLALIALAIVACKVIGKSKGGNLINPNNVIFVSLIKGNGDQVMLSDEDGQIILAFLNSGVYDKEKNDVKFLRVARIAPPAYNFSIKLKDEKEIRCGLWEGLDMIWFDEGYYRPTSPADINPTLEKYSK